MTQSIRQRLAAGLKWLRHALLTPDTWVWLYPLLLIVPNIALAITEFNSIGARIANILIPLGCWLIIAGLWRRQGVTILCELPVAVLCAFQIVLLYLYGEGIIAIDMFMNVFTTNPGEVGELLGNLKLALVTVVLIYLPPIVIAIYFCVRKKYSTARQQRLARYTGLVMAAAGVIVMAVTMIAVPGYKMSRELFPYNVTLNLVTSVTRTNEAMGYHLTATSFSYEPTMTRPKDSTEVYVFVIGETARAADWQLFGYDRPTNPRLSVRRNIFPFGKTLSQINTTHKSVPMLMSYLTSDNYGDNVARTRSVFSAFNDCGYQTVFVSNQRRNHSYIDFYGEEARTAIFLTDRGGPHDDIDLAGQLEKTIASSPSHKIFVILHAYGSHFEYRNRYTAEEAYFKPEHNSEASKLNRRQLVNAYDNTIRHTDLVLDSIISVLDRTSALSAMIYVSDHGEDIFDDGRERFLHSSPVPTYWQLHVPMLVWLSDKFIEQYPQKADALRANADSQVSSSRSAFHTLLDIAGINSPYFDSKAALTAADYTEVPHTYLNDYNESIPLRYSGLRDSDFVQLKNKGLKVD